MLSKSEIFHFYRFLKLKTLFKIGENRYILLYIIHSINIIIKSLLFL